MASFKKSCEQIRNTDDGNLMARNKKIFEWSIAVSDEIENINLRQIDIDEKLNVMNDKILKQVNKLYDSFNFYEVAIQNLKSRVTDLEEKNETLIKKIYSQAAEIQNLQSHTQNLQLNKN